jgi:energy-coupling factor transporter ATP-binding protein EcfA2
LSNDLTATIKLYNYRCFGETSPGIIPIRPGFTSFVGTNNAGKSSLLRAIRELLPVLAVLNDQDTLRSMAGGEPRGFGLEVEDQTEICHDRSPGPTIIDIALPAEKEAEIARLRFEFSRRGSWSLRLAVSPESRWLDAPKLKEDHFTFLGKTGGSVNIEFGRASALAKVLGSSIYIPAFRHAISGQTPAQASDFPVGQNFINKWAEWQTGGNKQQRARIQEVTATIERLFGLSRLNIQASNGNQTLQVFADNGNYRLREMGAGLTQLILTLATLAIQRPSLVLIDEPEINLHPTLQQEFLTAIGSYAEFGVMFATHSMGLARTAATQIYAVQRSNGVSSVRAWEACPNLPELLGELNYSAYRESGQARVLGVEGLQDVRPIQQFLRLLNLEHSTLVIPLGGDNLFTAAGLESLVEMQRLAPEVRVLLDSERESAGGAPKAGREEFVTNCAKLGILVKLTDRRSIESYFSDRAVRHVFGEDFAAPAPFESVKRLKHGWKKHENWKVAREIRVEELEGTDL